MAVGRGVVVEEYIEPLVGHMRQPLALEACVPPGGHATVNRAASMNQWFAAGTGAARE